MRDNTHVQVHYYAEQPHWRYAVYRGTLGSRERVALECLFEDLPQAPLPRAAVSFETLAVRVRERLHSRYPWAAALGVKLELPYRPAPFRRCVAAPDAATASDIRF